MYEVVQRTNTAQLKAVFAAWINAHEQISHNKQIASLQSVLQAQEVVKNCFQAW